MNTLPEKQRSKRLPQKKSLPQGSQYAYPCSEEEQDKAVESIKQGKSAGSDGLYPEFIKHFGKRQS